MQYYNHPYKYPYIPYYNPLHNLWHIPCCNRSYKPYCIRCCTHHGNSPSIPHYKHWYISTRNPKHNYPNNFHYMNWHIHCHSPHKMSVWMYSYKNQGKHHCIRMNKRNYNRYKKRILKCFHKQTNNLANNHSCTSAHSPDMIKFHHFRHPNMT